METLSTQRIARTLTLLIAVCAVLAGSGCASARKPGNSAPEIYGPAQPGEPSVSGQPYGPPMPPLVPQYGPAPQVSRSVVLVLGPGLARGYSYAGVIRALTQEKIKIGAIFGTEMGALMGSLYAVNGSVNQMEWGVLRFRDDVFQTDGSMLSKFIDRDPAEKLETSLERVFGSADLSHCKIPMRILIQPAGAGAKLIDRGPLRLITRAALGNSDGFSPVSVDGVPSGSAAAVRPFDVQDAKALGLGPVIVVDVLDPKESDLFPELKEADLVLQPNVATIGKTEFKKRTDAVFAGKAAVRDHIEEIKKLVGEQSP